MLFDGVVVFVSPIWIVVGLSVTATTEGEEDGCVKEFSASAAREHVVDFVGAGSAHFAVWVFGEVGAAEDGVVLEFCGAAGRDGAEGFAALHASMSLACCPALVRAK
jgi:hypothetical protein